MEIQCGLFTVTPVTETRDLHHRKKYSIQVKSGKYFPIREVQAINTKKRKKYYMNSKVSQIKNAEEKNILSL